MARPFRVEPPLEPMFQAWEAKGASRRHAGNLVALELGMPTYPTGWTLPELAHLRFLAELVRTGRISS